MPTLCFVERIKSVLYHSMQGQIYNTSKAGYNAPGANALTGNETKHPEGCTVEFVRSVWVPIIDNRHKYALTITGKCADKLSVSRSARCTVAPRVI